MIRLITVSIFLVSTLRDAAHESNKCGSGWKLINSTCFLMGLEQVKWSGARAICQNEGGSLLSVRSDVEMLQIIKEIKREFKWWVELQKTSGDNSWVSLHENSPFTVSLAKDVPTKVLSKEDCVVMDSDGLLSDVPCNSSSHLVMCVKQLANRTEKCGTGWFRIYKTCYKLSRITMPWSDAKESCEDDGGTLLFESAMNTLAWISLQSQWWWIGWQVSSDTCANVDSSGSLSSKDCETLQSYICERNQTSQLVKVSDWSDDHWLFKISVFPCDSSQESTSVWPMCSCVSLSLYCARAVTKLLEQWSRWH